MRCIVAPIGTLLNFRLHMQVHAPHYPRIQHSSTGSKVPVSVKQLLRLILQCKVPQKCKIPSIGNWNSDPFAFRGGSNINDNYGSVPNMKRFEQIPFGTAIG